jgi:hypothetical protein
MLPSRDPGDFLRSCQADAVASDERPQLGVDGRVCRTVRAPGQRRQSAPSNLDLG